MITMVKKTFMVCIIEHTVGHVSANIYTIDIFYINYYNNKKLKHILRILYIIVDPFISDLVDTFHFMYMQISQTTLSIK